jgi:iron-sulfur cluster assembly protein
MSNARTLNAATACPCDNSWTPNRFPESIPETLRERFVYDFETNRFKVDITITQRAAERILAAANEEGVSLGDTYLRIGVVSGGCSGLTYDLGWDTVRKEDDEFSEIAGLPVILDLSSYLYLEGSTLDFTEGLEGKGFHFNNPQAARTCACGESFSV